VNLILQGSGDHIDDALVAETVDSPKPSVADVLNPGATLVPMSDSAAPRLAPLISAPPSAPRILYVFTRPHCHCPGVLRSFSLCSQAPAHSAFMSPLDRMMAQAQVQQAQGQASIRTPPPFLFAAPAPHRCAHCRQALASNPTKPRTGQDDPRVAPSKIALRSLHTALRHSGRDSELRAQTACTRIFRVGARENRHGCRAWAWVADLLTWSGACPG
jgi:hypothetical protein